MKVQVAKKGCSREKVRKQEKNLEKVWKVRKNGIFERLEKKLEIPSGSYVYGDQIKR